MDPLQAQTTLIIRAIHSKMPIFESQYYKVSIVENIQPYSPVLSMQAYSPEGRKLIYSIVAGNTYEEFAVDFNTGKTKFDIRWLNYNYLFFSSNLLVSVISTHQMKYYKNMKRR